MGDGSNLTFGDTGLISSSAQITAFGFISESFLNSLKQPNMASEDFGVYTQTFPGCFFRFGAGYDEDPFIPVHVPEFYAEDETVFVGAMVLANCARLMS